MAHTIYDNFVLENEIEDQYKSHLDLCRFCTVDNSLTGTAGMKKKINTYSATDGTEKLALGEGNTKSIDVSFTAKEYDILLAQNKFSYYDEQLMIDKTAVQTGIRHMATDMFNTVNADIFAEFNKATLSVTTPTFDFGAIVDGVAKLNLESLEGVEIFGFISSDMRGTLSKSLKDTLQYVEAFARSGYVGTVAGVNLYTKKDAADDTIIIGTKEAVTLFNKKGTEIEQITKNVRGAEDANVRRNTIFSRKYYLAALTDYTKAVKITKGA